MSVHFSQVAWNGLVALVERSPPGSDARGRWRETGLPFGLLQLANYAATPALQECAVRGLTAVYADFAAGFGATAAAAVFPLLLRMLRSPLVSDSTAGAALSLLARSVATRRSVVLHVALEIGAVPELLTVLETPGVHPERRELADATLAILIRCQVSAPGSEGAAGHAERLTAVLHAATATDAPAAAAAALEKLSEIVEAGVASDAELRRLEVPAALAGGVRAASSGAAAAGAAQHVQCARGALCRFAARSLENAKAVFRQRGVPALVAALVDGPSETDRRAAADALRLMAASGGPLVRTAIRMARQSLDAQRACTQIPDGSGQTGTLDAEARRLNQPSGE